MDKTENRKMQKQPKPQPQPKMKEHKSKKGLIIFLIILIVLLGLGGGGYYYCKKKNISFNDIKTKVVKVFKSKDGKSTKQKQPAKKQESKTAETKEVNYTTYNWLSLNIRKTPNGAKIGAINRNSLLFVEEETSSGWLKVKVADKEGYVAKRYTKDKNGYFRDSYKTRNLTNQCKKLIKKCFTIDEQKILNQYEFRYMPDWIADCGGGEGVPLTSIYCEEPKVMYFRDSTFATAKSHDEILLHAMCHAITPETYGINSPFANRLKVAGYKAGIKKVKVHIGKTAFTNISTGY